uniref:Uncharacterized protein n=2 Tax=Timema TaxID=61471 RepID=A0A7R9PS40_TIMGE|nr:unnamed protein product [Timema genevievae]
MVLSYKPHHSGTKKVTSNSHLIDGIASRESEYHNRVFKNQRNSKIRVSRGVITLRVTPRSLLPLLIRPQAATEGNIFREKSVLCGAVPLAIVLPKMRSSWLLAVLVMQVVAQHANRGLECPSKGRRFNSTMTAYYPDYSSEEEAGYLDSRGKQLRTLQEFLDGRSDYVTAAMDSELGVTYGRAVCIPELNQHFGRPVRVEVRDTDSDMAGAGAARIDICVRSEVDSYDRAVNKAVTLVLL